MVNPTLQSQLETNLAKLHSLQANPLLGVQPTNIVPMASVPVTPVAPALTLESIESLLVKLIEEKFAGVVGNTNVVEPVKEITIIEALGNILTGAELKWLQDAKVISRIPEFVMTEEGQELTQQFFKAYRKNYES